MSTVTARAITGPDAWHGSDLSRTTDWIRPIPLAAIDEIDRALPPGFEVLWGSIEPGALRGGIAQA